MIVLISTSTPQSIYFYELSLIFYYIIISLDFLLDIFLILFFQPYPKAIFHYFYKFINFYFVVNFVFILLFYNFKLLFHSFFFIIILAIIFSIILIIKLFDILQQVVFWWPFIFLEVVYLSKNNLINFKGFQWSS